MGHDPHFDICCTDCTDIRFPEPSCFPDLLLLYHTLAKVLHSDVDQASRVVVVPTAIDLFPGMHCNPLCFALDIDPVAADIDPAAAIVVVGAFPLYSPRQ